MRDCCKDQEAASPAGELFGMERSGAALPVRQFSEGEVMSEYVKQVSDSEFEQAVLKSDKPVFVDFWAPWCGPCRIVGPVIEELAPSYDGKVVIAKMNVDDNPAVAQKFGVTSIPTMMIFKDGQVVDRVIGALPKSELQKFLDRNA
jgi:thioredoxin 1